VIVVNDMHERKALMSSSCNAFITLPGGFGTLEELYEITSWSLLGIHDKPIGFHHQPFPLVPLIKANHNLALMMALIKQTKRNPERERLLRLADRPNRDLDPGRICA